MAQYIRQVKVIEALNLVLDYCNEFEKDIGALCESLNVTSSSDDIDSQDDLLSDYESQKEYFKDLRLLIESARSIVDKVTYHKLNYQSSNQEK